MASYYCLICDTDHDELSPGGIWHRYFNRDKPDLLKDLNLQIIMPCNKKDFLNYVVRSLQQQTRRPSILVISDHTKKGLIHDDFPYHDFPIRMVRCKLPPWHVASQFNTLLDSPYIDTHQPILTLGDDLYLQSMFIENALTILATVPEAVICPIVRHDETGWRPDFTEESVYYDIEIFKRGSNSNYWSVFRYPGTGFLPEMVMGKLIGLCISKPKELRFDTYFDGHYSCEDTDWFFQHIYRGDLLVNGVGCLAVHLKHEGDRLNSETNTRRFYEKWNELI